MTIDPKSAGIGEEDLDRPSGFGEVDKPSTDVILQRAGKSTRQDRLAGVATSNADTSQVQNALIALLAAASGLLVSNLYLSQTLVGPIGHALGMSQESRGLIVTLTQLGYCAGLLLLVPLADLVENRRLSAVLAAGCSLTVLTQGLTAQPSTFLAACFGVGFFASAIQILVPLAAHFSLPEASGRAVGTVMSGLMMGIMLSRPVSSAIAQLFGWKAVFGVSSAVALATAVGLWKLLPERHPETRQSYLQLIGSMAKLYVTTPILLQRACYQAFMFGAFSAFWTAVPLYLAGPELGLDQGKIAVFALIGVAGVVGAPLAGMAADRGYVLTVTIAAMLTVAASFALTLLPYSGWWKIGLLLVAALGIDLGATANLVVGQKEVFALGAETRSRLNGLFIATFFVGGALGSALGAWAFAKGGWELTALWGGALPITALVALAMVESYRRVGARGLVGATTSGGPEV